MKKKEKTSYSTMTEEELRHGLSQINEHIASFMFEKQTKQIKNTREIRNMRRKRAVIYSILAQKEIAHE